MFHEVQPEAPGDAAPRTLVISERDFARSLASAAWDECEDVLIGLGDADLYRLDRQDQLRPPRARRALGRSIRRATGPELLLPPRRRGTPLPGTSYDLAVAMFYSVWNTPLLEALPGLRTAADGIVGWFPEVWPSQLRDELALEPFGLLDEIFVGEPRSAQQLSRILQRPVHVLPVATDVEIFSDGGRTSTEPRRARPIDVCNIGRRDSALHDRLLAWSESRDRYYAYDTTRGASVIDAIAHRRALARALQRTKVKVACFAKHDEPQVVGDLRWVPSRVWDGLASGTVLAGYAPETSFQRELFGREVVHDVPVDDPRSAADAIVELTAVDATPERIANVRTVMAGHDWSHRWVSLYRTCGVPVPDGVLERAERLSRQARQGGGPAEGGTAVTQPQRLHVAAGGRTDDDQNPLVGPASEPTR